VHYLSEHPNPVNESMTLPQPTGSPAWSASSKRLVLTILLVLALLLVYRIRILLLPLLMAFVLAYLIEPAVQFLMRRTPLPRIAVIVFVYLIVVAGLVSIPVSAITPIVHQTNNLINNTPQYLQQLGQFFQEPIIISEDIQIPIDQLSLDQAFASLSSNLVDIVQTLGSQTLTIFGSVATATLSTVGWTIMVLFLSFYLVKDHEQLFRSVVQMAPPAYHHDLYRLSREISITWNAFLRGQLVLCVVVGLIVFIMALVIGLPNAIILAIIASIAEFIPTIGPVLAAIPAALVAFFQAEASWLGSLMSPFWFAMLVLGLYGLIYQIENYYLVPHIIGHHLKLHPLVVILGALAGASVAGVLGIILAAPVLATARLIFMYIYCKLTDQPPFPDMVVVPAETITREANSAITNE
jgi:predicted PurR-regulated permease PerM